MELTQPVEWIEKSFIGYVMNTEYSEGNRKILVSLMDEITQNFGDAVFCMPQSSLHITLLDWVAPLVDYEGQNKDELFAKVKPEYDKAMTEILSAVGPITIYFETIRTSPSTIFIVGHDNGEFQRIREQFLEKVELLPGTKLPPQIIHSSLARFTKPLELAHVDSFLATKHLGITQEITNFRLIRSTKEPTLEFETLKSYPLKPF